MIKTGLINIKNNLSLYICLISYYYFATLDDYIYTYKLFVLTHFIHYHYHSFY